MEAKVASTVAQHIANVGQKNVSETSPVPKVNFAEVLKGVSQGGGQDNIHADLVKLSYAIHSGKNISARELLFYQIRAGQFGLQVEMASKLGESLSSTIRKLEQGH